MLLEGWMKVPTGGESTLARIADALLAAAAAAAAAVPAGPVAAG